VQGAVRTVFELFQREGSAFAVVQRFNELGLRFPRRAYGGAWDGKLIWGRLTHSRVIGMLANPTYAGTYVFGRFQSCKHISPNGEICTQVRRMPEDEWRVTIPDHHPGYITQEQFLANRQRLPANRTNAEVLAGPAGEGLCLLQGLLLCGRVGGASVSATPVMAAFTRFISASGNIARLASRACMSVPYKPLDGAIAERVVAAVTPVTIELALTALTSLEERDQAIGAQWQRRIERAHYDADLAERRYEAVDPHNRLIASTLEQRWNNACSNSRPSSPTSSARRCAPSPPNKGDKSCSWRTTFHGCGTAPSTEARDRKRMIRLLIK
jgi:recombinase